MKLAEIDHQTEAAIGELLEAAGLKTGQILVVGCSTSEVAGAKIGTGGSPSIAQVILSVLHRVCDVHGVHLAIQCCEHLNRALVVERSLMERHNLEQVSVLPTDKAGGALSTQAIADFVDPVVVEFIRADAGIDIGSTLIGMHIKHVAVPVRLSQRHIGQATVTAAYARPKLIGGPRAVYCT